MRFVEHRGARPESGGRRGSGRGPPPTTARIGGVKNPTSDELPNSLVFLSHPRRDEASHAGRVVLVVAVAYAYDREFDLDTGVSPV